MTNRNLAAISTACVGGFLLLLACSDETPGRIGPIGGAGASGKAGSGGGGSGGSSTGGGAGTANTGGSAAGSGGSTGGGSAGTAAGGAAGSGSGGGGMAGAAGTGGSTAGGGGSGGGGSGGGGVAGAAGTGGSGAGSGGTAGTAGAGGSSAGSGGMAGAAGAGGANGCPAKGTWTATASHTQGGESPSLAIDGDAASRWASGRRQGTGGIQEWFQVDFGMSVTISSVTLQNDPASLGDYPRGYDVIISNTVDNTSGQAQVSQPTNSQTTGTTVVQITPAASGRYLLIKQTGVIPETDPLIWWTMGELDVVCN